MKHKYPYKWFLKDTVFTKDKGTVFSCFAGGGGSSMGYKLVGFDVLGCNEIDQKMMEVYKINLNPKYAYLEPIQTFKLRNDLPKELYNLDILDGSPPCSSFSITGNREKDWGKEKKFREGQKKQVLDTLFFDFIDLVEKLQPKIVIAENVKGLILGEAKKYVGEIGKAFDKAGYYVNKWLLNTSKMGVPQSRERVFFIAMRKDLTNNFSSITDMFNPMPKLDLKFNEKEILFKEICDYAEKTDNLSELYLKYWEKAGQGESVGKFQCNRKLDLNKVASTLTTRDKQYHPLYKRRLNDLEICKEQSFPLDYNFLNTSCNYVCGMSVPPIMMTQIANRIIEQWNVKELKSEYC